MAQNIHVPHYHQERQQREDDEEFHGAGIGLLVVFVACLAKDERLIGISESLCNHRHDHGDLACGTEDTELCVCIAALVDVGEEDVACRLVQYSGNAQDKNRPGIRQHFLRQRHIKQLPARKETFFQFSPEAEGDGSRADKVDVECVTHLMSAENKIVDKVQDDVQSDEQQLECRKLYRTLLVPEVGKRNALEGVNRHRNRHYPYIRGVRRVAHETADGLQEDENHCNEQQ